MSNYRLQEPRNQESTPAKLGLPKEIVITTTASNFFSMVRMAGALESAMFFSSGGDG